MTTAQKSRGNSAEIPREVNFLAIARGFRGNGNLNPAHWGKMTVKRSLENTEYHKAGAKAEVLSPTE